MWQPIETAPRDRHFLAWARLVCDETGEDDRVLVKDKVQHYAVVAYYAFGGIVEYPWRGGVPSNVTFTHWQELPPGPKARCLDSVSPFAATKEDIAELANAIRTAFRRAGGLPLLLRAPDGQQKICEIAAREALAQLSE